MMDDVVISKKTLDLRKIFREKAPGMSKWIPGFAYRLLEKKVRQKEFNEFLYKNKDKHGLDFIDAGLKYIGANFEFTGVENIKPKGRYILASNHPIGGPEGLALMQMVGKIGKDFSFLSNDILMNLPNLRSLITPVNKHGSNAEYVQTFNRTFESDKMVLIFPAGLVSRKQDGKIRDLVWKTSFITRAVKHKRSIIPVYVDGKNSNFFYTFSRLRTKLGIKANLEMFLLMDEMLKQKNKTIKITVGEAIPYTVFNKRMNYKNWTELVKEYIYDLKHNSELIFDDAYIEEKKALLKKNEESK